MLPVRPPTALHTHTAASVTANEGLCSNILPQTPCLAHGSMERSGVLRDNIHLIQYYYYFTSLHIRSVPASGLEEVGTVFSGHW